MTPARRFAPRLCLQCPTWYTPRSSTEKLCPTCAPEHRRTANRAYEAAKRRGQKISTKVVDPGLRLKPDDVLEREMIAWWDARYGGYVDTEGRQERSTICDI